MNHSKQDWTKKFSRKKLSNQSNNLINNIIKKIFYNKIKLFYSLSLSEKEIGLLFQWSLYVSINTFVERLVRVLNNNKKNSYNNFIKSIKYSYFTNLNEFTLSYYNNNNLNNKLMIDIEKIIYENKSFNTNQIFKPKKKILNHILSKNYSLKGLYNFFHRNIGSKVTNFFKINNINFLYDESKWLDLIFDHKYKMKKLNYYTHDIDHITRKELRNCFKEEFLKFFKLNFKEYKINSKLTYFLSDLFSVWIDCSFPQSLVEGLKIRSNFYSNYTKNKKIKYIHSCTGFFFNDNLKVLSYLAKRNRTLLIAHEHGVNNFQNYFPSNYKVANNFKNLNQINYVDIYFAWGSGKLGDFWNNVKFKSKTKIYNLGSVYLNNISKNRIKNKKKHNIYKQIELFYISGPSRKFQINLEDISTEKDIEHRKNISNFLRKLILENNNLRITYKPFMNSNLKEDFIYNNLKDLFFRKKIIVCYEESIKQMNKSDLVFFDMISTGFAEAYNIQIPSIVFANKYHYNQASKQGKKINDKLENIGRLFYDIDTGIKLFNKSLKNNFMFSKYNKSVFQKFQKLNSFPINKKEFLKKMNKILQHH